MSSVMFKGVATALITPFKNGHIDYKAFSKLIDFQISEGADALVVCGTTGESATLSIEERKELTEFCVKEVRGRVPVIAGTGSNNTVRTVSLSEDAESVGADGLLIVTPYYNKASRQGIIEHYRTVAERTSLPILVYNVPSRTGLSVSPEVYSELLKIPGIVGIKEASGNIPAMIKTLSLSPEAMLYTGNDSDVAASLAVGAQGVISVASNAYPAAVSKLCRAFFEGDASGAALLQRKLCSLNELLFAEVNPIPIKYVMHRLGLCGNELRLPLTPLSGGLCEHLDRCMEELSSEGLG